MLYAFADRFGWTPEQVYAQPWQVIEDFRVVMGYQAQRAGRPPANG
jgi:hypothetical protein